MAAKAEAPELGDSVEWNSGRRDTLAVVTSFTFMHLAQNFLAVAVHCVSLGQEDFDDARQAYVLRFRARHSGGSGGAKRRAGARTGARAGSQSGRDSAAGRRGTGERRSSADEP